MDWTWLEGWLNTAPILIIAGVVLVAMLISAVGCAGWRARNEARRPGGEAVGDNSQEGYLVSAVLGLLALLLGFTFALAIDRFDARRLLVVAEANAIGTTYLRAQLLEEPHRSRISGLLIEYIDNRIVLARAQPDEEGARLLANNERIITDLWAATAGAFESVKDLDFSSSFIEGMNAIVELDSTRKAARRAHVPPEVLFVLFLYLVATAAVLGYALSGRRVRITASLVLLLLTLSLVLIIDIDRPTRGGVVESQAPMERLRESLRQRPPAVFDRWRAAREDANAARSANHHR